MPVFARAYDDFSCCCFLYALQALLLSEDFTFIQISSTENISFVFVAVYLIWMLPANLGFLLVMYISAACCMFIMLFVSLFGFVLISPHVFLWCDGNIY